jgi:glycosyltransferase involved in cell wall biosynthesis
MGPVGGIIVVVPAYNEDKYIPGVLKPLIAAKNGGIIRDTVVVNDGSTDNTSNVIDAFHLKQLKHPENRGKSGAFRTGAKYCRDVGAEYMVMMDADVLDLTPKKVKALVEPLRKYPNLSMTVANATEGGLRHGKDELLRVCGIRAIRMSALKPLFDGDKVWDRYIGKGFMLEAGLFCLFTEEETRFLPGVRLDCRKFTRGNTKQHMLEIMDIEEIQNMLNRAARSGNPSEIPPRYRREKF